MTLSTSPSITTTTTPIQWLQVQEAVRLFGLSRSYLYELIAAKKIASVCLRKSPNIRGKRLISAESLNAFIESHVVQPQPVMEDAK